MADRFFFSFPSRYVGQIVGKHAAYSPRGRYTGLQGRNIYKILNPYDGYDPAGIRIRWEGTIGNRRRVDAREVAGTPACGSSICAYIRLELTRAHRESERQIFKGNL